VVGECVCVGVCMCMCGCVCVCVWGGVCVVCVCDKLDDGKCRILNKAD